MARVDKTDSAVGVVRADLHEAFAVGDFDKVIAVGLNASGHVVKGAGQSGIKGVVIPGKFANVAGRPVDIFVLADIVDCVGLAAGTSYFADVATGVVSALNTGTPIGFTVEADRLIVRL